MRCIVFIFLLFIVNTSRSQSNFLINKFDVENISSENINSILLDKNNFFWVSTPEGLNRYDGSINSIFKSNPFDSTTLSNNLVYETFQINNNGLYIKSSSGLDYFSYSKNNFIRTDVRSPLYHTRDNKNLYLSSKNDGVFILNLKNQTSNNLKFDPRNPLSISSSNFTTFQNDIILVNGNGHFFYSKLNKFKDNANDDLKFKIIKSNISEFIDTEFVLDNALKIWIELIKL